MDFSLTEEQQDVRDLARQILSEGVSHERLLALSKSGEWFDMDLWKTVAGAGLPAVALPEGCGGSGFGPIELALVLEEMGRHVAPIPLLATSVLAAAPIARFGSDAQRERWLAPLTSEAAVLSAALVESGSSDPARPRTTARRDGDGWLLSGEKICVPAGHLARLVLVPARSDDGVGVFGVDPSADGVTVETQVSTSGEPQARLLLEGVRVGADDVLGDVAGGADVVQWTVHLATLALAAVQVGVAAGALADTAKYVAERKQFGRPIATFQGVALRAADAWIDVECLRATVLQAAWRLANGRPAEAEIAAAKWWAATAGMRVVHTAQHLHAGIGSDMEYPVHRYFLWAKQNELLFGGANQQLANIGALLVADERAGAGA
ncbi:MAG: acyl-CoA dehydrogenase family protein [Myxococcota bacterium]